MDEGSAYRQKCSLGCGAEGPAHEDPFESAALAVEQGFIEIKVPDASKPERKRLRFLCVHCAKHVRAYFLGERERIATSADVLVPEGEDEDFENDTGW